MALQLKMIYQTARNPQPVVVPALPGGFAMRTLRPEAEMEAYKQLRQDTGFGGCNKESVLEFILKTTYPGALLVVEELATGKLVASACAQRGYFKGYANLGWVMTDPAFRGRALGKIVTLQALKLALEQGVPGMTLTTDDFREPALRIYLKAGWRPWIFTEEDDMRRRWAAIAGKLSMDEATELFEEPLADTSVPM